MSASFKRKNVSVIIINVTKRNVRININKYICISLWMVAINYPCIL
jgi:hypothetical protein